MNKEEIYRGILITTNKKDNKKLSYGEIRIENIKLKQALQDIKEYIEEMQVWCVEFDTFGVDTKGLEYIVNKALGSEKE